MDTKNEDPVGGFVPDENEPEAVKELDQAMANIVRALNTLHKLGVPQELVLKLVESRAKLRWQSNIDKEGIPTLGHWLEDPQQRKIRGSSSKARASQTQASKFKRKIEHIKRFPEAKATVVQHFEFMFDALTCTVDAKRGEQKAMDNIRGASPIDGDATIVKALGSLPLLK